MNVVFTKIVCTFLLLRSLWKNCSTRPKRRLQWFYLTFLCGALMSTVSAWPDLSSILGHFNFFFSQWNRKNLHIVDWGDGPQNNSFRRTMAQSHLSVYPAIRLYSYICFSIFGSQNPIRYMRFNVLLPQYSHFVANRRRRFFVDQIMRVLTWIRKILPSKRCITHLDFSSGFTLFSFRLH